MATFDLIIEPWLPCEEQDGTPVELGIAEALRRAHELRGLSDPSPIVTAALHRLLLAIVHRCVGPSSLAEWARVFQRGRFEWAPFDAYLNRWRTRFDLFDPHRPFFQTAGLPYKAVPARQLIAEYSNYGAPVNLFEHRPPGDDERIEPARAARALVAAHAYRPGGLVARAAGEPPSAKAGPLNAAAVILVRGESLFETLVMNLLVYAPAAARPIPATDSDAPAWEHDEPTSAGARIPRGWLDLLTWQSRRIELRRDAAGAIAQVVIAGGWDLDGQVLDPMVGYRQDPKRGWLPIRIVPERATWRDADALLVADLANGRRPQQCELLAAEELVEVLGPRRHLLLDVIGLAGNQAKIHLTRHESIPASRALLADPDLGAVVAYGVRRVEEIGKALDSALWVAFMHALSMGERSPAADDVRALKDAGGGARAYWANVHAPFLSFLVELADADLEAPVRLEQRARRAAELAFQTGTDALGTTTRGLRSRALGERTLKRSLRELNQEVAA